MKLKDCIPFVECPQPHIGANRDAIAFGLRQLVGIFDRAIVVTSPGRETQLYRWLREQVPGIKVLGGLKTSQLVGGSMFTNPLAWESVRTYARSVAHETGENVCVLENESALSAFHQNAIDLDTDEMRAALSPLRESPICYWWYMPSIVPDAPTRPRRWQRTLQLTAAVARSVKPTWDWFIPGYGRTPDRFDGLRDWGLHQSINDANNRLLRDAGSIHEMVVVTSTGLVDGRPCFLPWQFVERVKTAIADHVVINIGAGDWVRVAEMFQQIHEKQENQQMPATTIGYKVVKQINWGPRSGSLISRGFRITAPQSAPLVTGTSRTVAAAASQSSAPLRDPEIPTGAYARSLFGHGNGRTVLVDGVRCLEVMTRFFNTDQAGMPVSETTKLLHVSQPLLREDAFNPLIHLNIGEILTSHDTAFEEEHGDEARTWTIDDIPPVWLVPAGVSEYVAIYTPIPDNVLQGELFAVGFKCGR